MNLSGLKKLASVVRAKVQEAIKAPEDEHEAQNAALSQHHEDHESAVVLEEGKRQVHIQCWKCGRTFWAKRGSISHRKGLCGQCLSEE